MSGNSWQTFKKYVRNGEGVYMTLAKVGLKDSDPDEVYLRHAYKANFGRELDLEHPKRFNEKLQWLKLHDRRPEYAAMVDKYEAKKFVAERIGAECVIPSYGVWNRCEDIDFDALPDQFVLKCTHDSGGLVICRDKKSFDIPRAKRYLSKRLRWKYHLFGREWPYQRVKPRILAEKYLPCGGDTPERGIEDYKFFCFDGKVKCFKVDFDRFSFHRANYFDPGGNLLHFGEAAFPPDYERPVELPANLDEMVDMSERLSRGVPFLRVDLYNVAGIVYFGELTFFPQSGFGLFTPDEWDCTLGSWITLPTDSLWHDAENR